MINFRISIEGTAPLLMHNARLSNPIDPSTKAIKKVTSKRNKTDEDHEEIARLEHAGSMYLDPDVGPYLPGDNLWRALYDAAKKQKLGPRVKEGVFIATDVNPLAYPGPRDLDGLWADLNFRLMSSVKVMAARTMRCRPMFRQWRTEADGVLDPNILNLEELNHITHTAGALIGVGDWRPRYGRFMASVKVI